MTRISSTLRALAVAATVAVAIPVALEAVDVTVDYDKAFDFKPIRTWGWDPSGAGEVKMARTADDDPDAMTRLVEPIIRDSVSTEMMRRGLTEASSAPDVTVTYFLLLTISTSAQSLGQFLPATVQWGIPPFAPATQSLTVMNKGALVLDARAKGIIVWRGVAQSQIDIGVAKEKREDRVREAVRDLLRRFPPR